MLNFFFIARYTKNVLYPYASFHTAQSNFANSMHSVANGNAFIRDFFKSKDFEAILGIMVMHLKQLSDDKKTEN